MTWNDNTLLNELLLYQVCLPLPYKQEKPTICAMTDHGLAGCSLVFADLTQVKESMGCFNSLGNPFIPLGLVLGNPLICMAINIFL